MLDIEARAEAASALPRDVSQAQQAVLATQIRPLQASFRREAVGHVQFDDHERRLRGDNVEFRVEDSARVGKRVQLKLSKRLSRGRDTAHRTLR